MVEQSKVPPPLQGICMCQSVLLANGHARRHTIWGRLSTRNQMHSSQTRSRAANKHLCSTFASDTYGRHASLYCRTPPVSINRLYQVGIKCSQWWYLVIGCYETAVDLCIRLHFDKPLRKLWRLWVHGDWADEPYTHAWGYSPIESKRLANCVF